MMAYEISRKNPNKIIEKMRLSFYQKYLYVYSYIWCLNIYKTHMTANNTINNNVVLFFVSDMKIVSNNNY